VEKIGKINSQGNSPLTGNSFEIRRIRTQQNQYYLRNRSYSLISFLSEGLQFLPEGKALKEWKRHLQHKDASLKNAYDRLKPATRKFLIQQLGPNFINGIISISQNPNDHLYAGSLYRLAFEQEDRENRLLPPLLYKSVLSLPGSKEYAEKSRRRLQVLQGGGSFGERLEFQAGYLLKQLLDPGLLGGMLIAGSVFQLSRLGALRFLRSLPASSLLRGPQASRGLSWIGAVLTEAPAFTLGTKGIHQIMGRQEDWSLASLKNETLSAAISLGALRAVGAGSEKILQSLSKVSRAPSGFIRFSQKALPQLGMLTAIMGGHSLEAYWGFRPSSQHFLEDSLTTLLHFNLAGFLLHRLSGGAYQGFIKNMERQARTEIASNPSISIQTLVTPEGSELGPINILMAESKEGKGSDPRNLPSERTIEKSEKPPLPIPDRESYKALNAGLHRTGGRIIHQLNFQYGDALWLLQARCNAAEFLTLNRMIRKQIRPGPRSRDYEELLEKYQVELRSLLSWISFARRFNPPLFQTKKIQGFFGNLYRSYNKMINFLDYGEPLDLRASVNELTFAKDNLRKIFRLPEDYRPPQEWGNFESQRGKILNSTPEYTFPQDSDFLEIPHPGNKVVVVGVGRSLDADLVRQQKVEVFPSSDWDLSHLKRTFNLMGLSENTRLTLKSDWKTEVREADYLIAYDEAIDGYFAHYPLDALTHGLLNKLKPGGIGYFVTPDRPTFRSVVSNLAWTDKADIIEGSLGAPLPVKTQRMDSHRSNYVFFRKLPY